MSGGGKIYVIGTKWGEPIKIGVARDPERRRERLQVANPATLAVLWQSDELKDPFGVETAVHGVYDRHRLRGEWFQIPDLGETTFAAVVAGIGVALRQPRPQEDTSKVCSEAVAFLLEREQRRGLQVGDAIQAIADKSGLGRSTIWALRYRPPVDLYVSAYAAVLSVLWAELGQPAFSLDTLPMPEDVQAVLRGEPAPIRPPPRDLEKLTSLTSRLQAAISEAEAALGGQTGTETLT